MKKNILTLLALFIIGTFVPVSAQSDPGITTFILVRHAEKADQPQDPHLSPGGYERAERLAGIFQHVPFDAVYSTPLNRTMETVHAIADASSAEIQEYNHREPERVVVDWIEKHSGETVLISGHSNTTPAFANALLGREHFPDKFDESDYGNLLVITIDSNGDRKMMHLRY